MRNKLVCLAVVFALTTAVRAQDKEKAKDTTKSTANAVVAVFSLDGPIVETPKGEELFRSEESESLHDLVARIKKAAEDKDVRAGVILLGHTNFNLAQVEEMREAIDALKAAGKPVYVHADSLHIGGYALLCGASRVSVVPTGDLWITGLYGEMPYLRGLLDKMGVKPDFLTCGAYKSAAEIFMRTGPSKEADQMQSWLLDGMYETCVSLIASGRNVSTEKARQWIDGGPYTAEKALKLGIIDASEHRQDFLATLKSKYGEKVKFDKKYGKKKTEELDLSSPMGLFKLWAELLAGPGKKIGGKESVAIVYVDGAIVTGKRQPTPFGDGEGAFSTNIRQALDEAANDASVKAVVLRIDSPGGSATASEIILDATKRVKAKKPLVVSMGGVAGSGGYYVACGADTIFADDSTITGSIGVVGGKFATTDMWNKLGIAWKSWKRGAEADILSSERVFSEAQRAKMQAYMDEIYEVFKGHVVAIRGSRLKKKIDDIAGGRVYTGHQALELGLVDRIGTLSDAISFVAKKADLKEGYDVRVIPRPKSFVELLVAGMSDKDSDDDKLSLRLPAASPSTSLLQLALPYLGTIEPLRLEAIRTALGRLEMIQQERAVLMMPEIRIGQ